MRRIPRALRQVREQFVEGNRVWLLRDGVEAFPAMLDAIANAERQVLLEMYWFASDKIGRRFASALSDAAARGVQVLLIFDSLGSWESDIGMFEEIRRAGAHVVEYNPVLPWHQRFRLVRLTRRDHRKILVVDGEVGFTGGINIADQWLPETEDGAAWRDDMARLEGPAVRGLVEIFDRTWRAQGGALLASRDPTVEAGGGSQRVRVLGENYFRNRLEIVRAYLSNIYRAERRVWITNSYFTPDRAVVRALKLAGDRGVDVRVLLPGQSDVEAVRHASRAMWGGLMRHNVRIFEWQQTMLHAKTAVIDGVWSTIGTFNLDYRSLRSNLEVNVSVMDEGFAALLEASFLRDLEQSREVDPHEFQFRSLGDRLLELVLYRFRKLL
jgi:cardiolipin synthase A/B